MNITASHLGKKFGSKTAVHDLNLTIEQGKVLGLLGPNGAGKSTTIKMLSGQMHPDSGVITIMVKIMTGFLTICVVVSGSCRRR
ncbi:MAG: putative ABC transporter ATP-binding protein YjjK [candidate division WS6 bacterium OLB20]|uniref:Putative ABC transporter ATP-binding protein YjjK n=1 Tax=candidate division WS6 bacterium OLB20 TaxID=1617426 RepID=A0A136LZC7_9BACT|nr:MAG: putative ABC transporter ATP-binding protein YjjK [candidate division WS6 bacterium OLB20]